MANGILMSVPMLLGVLWAAKEDLAHRRIPNWLNAVIALSGIAQSFLPASGLSWSDSILGLLVGFGLMFVLFGLGALGGGDVKLMAAVGAWLGPWLTLQVFAFSAIASLIIVLAQAIKRGRIAALFRNSAVLAMNIVHVRELGVEHTAETGRTWSTIDRPVPYAVPILIAVLWVITRNLLSAI